MGSLARQEELRSHNVPHAVRHEEQSSGDAALREACDVGRDDAQREWNVDREDGPEGQTQESFRSIIHSKLPHKCHADERHHRIQDHHGDTSSRDKGCNGGCDEEEDDLCGAEGHLEQERLQLREPKTVDQDIREL